MKNKLPLVLFFIFVFSLSFVLAQGLEVPHQFYGTATYNGVASENIKVEAYYGASVIKTIFSVSNGLYNLKVEDPDEFEESETITFYLNDINTGTTLIFENGASTKLDLSASSGQSSSSSSSSSGGGGGGSSFSPSTNTNTQTTNGTVDLNIEIEKDETSEETTTNEEQQSTISGITGAVIGFAKTGKGIGTGIALLIIIMGIVVMAVQKKKTKKE